MGKTLKNKPCFTINLVFKFQEFEALSVNTSLASSSVLHLIKCPKMS